MDCKELHRETRKKCHLAVTKIFELDRNSQKGTASGFFFLGEDQVTYLITNRHVVIDEKKGKYPDQLRINVHTDPEAANLENLDKTRNITIDLYNCENPIWFEHPELMNRADVVALDLSSNLAESDVIFPFSTCHIRPLERRITYGTSVFVLGFPIGFSDTENNLPIARGATLSSLYGVNFEGYRYFMIDSELHEGISGSPVLCPPQERTLLYGIGGETWLLGVLSHDLPHLRLGKVWYPQLIQEIVKGRASGRVIEIKKG